MGKVHYGAFLTKKYGKLFQTQTMFKLSFTTLILFFLVTAVTAQRNGEAQGILLNNAGEPLPFATATIYKSADTSLIAYVLTEDDGCF